MRKKATAAIVVALVVAGLATGYLSGSTKTITSTPSNTSSTSFPAPISMTPTSTTTVTFGTTTGGWLLRACNCSLDLSKKVWPEYTTMHDLASASLEVIVGEVTAEHETGGNDSFLLGGNDGLVPVTNYNITVTAMVIDGGYGLEQGFWLIVPQMGGTFAHTTMNTTGYPTLAVGASYVLFLTDKQEIEGIYDYSLTTTGGAQGLFYIQYGKVYSLDNIYPQADGWLPVKADGVPLYQFLTDVQLAYEGLLPITTTSSESTTSTSTAISTPSCSPSPTSNYTSSNEREDYYDVTRQFDSWQWNGTLFQIGGYNITVAGFYGTSRTPYLLPAVSLVVSNGQTSQEATFVNLGPRNGQAWPPDFQRGPVPLFGYNVTADWGFSCDMRVFIGVAVRNP